MCPCTAAGDYEDKTLLKWLFLDLFVVAGDVLLRVRRGCGVPPGSSRLAAV